MLWLLLSLLSITGSAEAGKTYSNPVLVDVIKIKNTKSDYYPGTLGIGDPAVIFHKDK